MEIKLLGLEEIPKAAGLIRGVYDICVRPHIAREQMNTYFDEYVSQKNLADLMLQQRLILWGIYEAENLCAVSGMQTEGHITLVYVHPAYQNRGYGKALVSGMKKYAYERTQKTKITVNAMPVQTETFFKKCGFRRMKKQAVGQAFISMEAETTKVRMYPKKSISAGAILGMSLGTFLLIVLVATGFLISYVNGL